MTLRDIAQAIKEIQDLAETSPEEAIRKNTELFLEFARQDYAFIVPDAPVTDDRLLKKQFHPFASPAQAEDPRLFLRIFSQEDVAKTFADNNHLPQPVLIDGVELMQLAKFYFLRGVYGYLLNDGLAWAVISLPEFLTACFQEILGDTTLARKEFIQLVEFINQVRRNDFYRLVVGRQSVKNADDPEKLLFLSPTKQANFQNIDFEFELLTMPKLISCANASDNAHIHVRTDRFSIQVSSGMLRAVLHATGNDTNADEFNEAVDFHLSSIALDFCMNDFSEQDKIIARSFQLAELPALDEQIPDEEASDEAKQTQETQNAHFLGKLKFKQSNKEIEESKKNGLRQHLHTKFISRILLGVGIAACFLLFFNYFIATTPQETIEKAIAQGNYTEVLSAYQNAVEKKPAQADMYTAILEEDLNTKLQEYADNKCSAEELRNTIDSYQTIPAMQSKVAIVYQSSSALELSKMAYGKGAKETSIFSKLAAWQDVIQADTGSKALMQEDLETHQSEYKYMAFLEAQQEKPSLALSHLLLLQSYYPQSADITAQIKKTYSSDWQKETFSSGQGQSQESLLDAAISITRVSVQESVSTWDGKINLYISWQNCSGKEIDRVLFTVVPYDRAGKVAYTKEADEDGEYYSTYLATDEGPFSADYVTPKRHYWNAAWYNSSIVSAQITSITVYFSDGSLPVTYDSTQVQKLFS